MRHAKSSWDDSSLEDIQRPLNERGKKAAYRMGCFLKRTNNVPDLIMCSPAMRAEMTLQGVIDGLGQSIASENMDELYPGYVREIMTQIKQVKAVYENVMLIGHNPFMENMVAFLLKNKSNMIVMPTAAMVLFETEAESWAEWDESSVSLKGFVTPKLIKNVV